MDVVTEFFEEEREFLQRQIDENTDLAERARAHLALLPPFRDWLAEVTERLRADKVDGGVIIDGITYALAEMLSSLVTFYGIPLETADKLIHAQALDIHERAMRRLRSPGMVVIKDAAGHERLGTLEGVQKENRT